MIVKLLQKMRSHELSVPSLRRGSSKRTSSLACFLSELNLDSLLLPLLHLSLRQHRNFSEKIMEEQFILRVPPNIAEQLNRLLEGENSSLEHPNLELEFEGYSKRTLAEIFS